MKITIQQKHRSSTKTADVEVPIPPTVGDSINHQPSGISGVVGARVFAWPEEVNVDWPEAKLVVTVLLKPAAEEEEAT